VSGPPVRVLVLTPRLDGADGISEVSRQAVAALRAALGDPAVDVWVMQGGAGADVREKAPRICLAQGSRSRLVRWALARARTNADGLLVVALHLHLAPVALPLELRGARLAVFFHGVEAWRALRPRERAAIQRAEILLANSTWTAVRFAAANPAFAERRVGVCHLGVGDATEAIQPGETGFALIVGRLSSAERYKGHDALIDAWPAVLARFPDARLVVAGDGDDRPRLERRVQDRGLSRQIRFVGQVPDDELAGLYRASAFFVMPSAGEGFGLAYLEAMRASKACVAGSGAAEEIVIDGTTGLIVDPASPVASAALAAALVRLFADPAARDTMGRAGALRWRDHFTARHFAARLLRQLAVVPLVVPA
jgi:phosphatidylinositol alpha-1,6-mannosyltransferase